MKKCGFVFTVILCLICLNHPEYAQAQDSEYPALDVSPLDMASYPARAAFRNYLGEEDRHMRLKIRVMYSRPQVKGRTIFGDLVPYGKEWRLGANEATEIRFSQAVDIGGQTVPVGYYTMHALVDESNWTINFSTERNIWGSHERDTSQDVASITVPVEEIRDPLEYFTISFQRIDDDNCHMVMGWADKMVKVPINFNPILFFGPDSSPMDLVQFPDQSRYLNYLEADKREGMASKIRVTYSRPQKKGREIFGKLVPYGEVWRIGANESTEISLNDDVKIGDVDVRRGSYALYAEVNTDSWDLILSTDLPAAGNANRDEEKDAYRIRVPSTTDDEVIEVLTILLKEDGDGAMMIIAWDTTRVSVPIGFK